MRVLFLDVDGVLNRWGVSSNGLDEIRCERLAEAVRLSECKVVISSTWRLHPNAMEKRLLPMLITKGIECVGVTPVVQAHSILIAAPRRDEIRQWLNDHPEVTDYVILDDDVDADDGTGRYVQTLSTEGMMDYHIYDIVKIFKNGPKSTDD